MRGFGDRGKHTLKTLQTESPEGFGFLVYWFCCNWLYFYKNSISCCQFAKEKTAQFWLGVQGMLAFGCLLTSGWGLSTCRLIVFVIINFPVFSVCALNNTVMYLS